MGSLHRVGSRVGSLHRVGEGVWTGKGRECGQGRGGSLGRVGEGVWTGQCSVLGTFIEDRSMNIFYHMLFVQKQY